MDKVGRIKMMISHIDDSQSLTKISGYCKKRSNLIWERKYKEVRADHVSKIKALGPGTLVMVRQNGPGWRVGEVGEIAYHKPGASRSIVQFQDTRFSVPCGWLDPDFDLDKQRQAISSYRMTAKLNQVFSKLL